MTASTTSTTRPVPGSPEDFAWDHEMGWHRTPSLRCLLCSPDQPQEGSTVSDNQHFILDAYYGGKRPAALADEPHSSRARPRPPVASGPTRGPCVVRPQDNPQAGRQQRGLADRWPWCRDGHHRGRHLAGLLRCRSRWWLLRGIRGRHRCRHSHRVTRVLATTSVSLCCVT
jgi:hypothetical protein